MYEDEDYGAEMEAIEAERWDADCQQADYEAEGRRFSRAINRMTRLRAEGKLAEAADACPHSGGYPLTSLAAGYANDPRAGELGVRCNDCGSVLDQFPWDGDVTVLNPCEVPPRD